MSKYSKAYQEDHNIDWFAIIDGRYYHFASGGTYLPDEVNNKEQNRKLQHFVAQKNIHRNDIHNGVSINRNYFSDVHSIVQNQFEGKINAEMGISLCSADAAHIGFYSYCYWGIDKWGGIIYRLIASPAQNINPEFDEQLTVPELMCAHFMSLVLHLDEERTIPEFIRVCC